MPGSNWTIRDREQLECVASSLASWNRTRFPRVRKADRSTGESVCFFLPAPFLSYGNQLRFLFSLDVGALSSGKAGRELSVVSGASIGNRQLTIGHCLLTKGGEQVADLGIDWVRSRDDLRDACAQPFAKQAG